jgi:hypothetical protein
MNGKLLLLLFLCPLALAGPLDPLAHGLGDVFRATPGPGWAIEDGILSPARSEDSGFVVSTARYTDVEITLEFHPEAGTNSGVFTRCQQTEDINPVQCYEFNIWDAHPNQQFRTGAIVTLAPPVVIVDTEDKWNTMRVRVEGPRLRVWINDSLTNDIENDKLTDGFIALQYGGASGMVRFRNIRINELP